jgi:iron(II)-dependent oxidoreductase
MNEIRFCYVQSGPFFMGSSDADEMAFDDEKPLHQLDLPYNYWLSRYPVTVAQFTTFVEESGYFPRDDKPLRDLSNCPVVNVTWRDAIAFCRWLNEHWQQQGLIPADWQVTLPSEAEWEKGARGGLNVPEASLVKPVQEIDTWQPEIKLKANDNPERRYPWGDNPDSRLANYDQTGIDRASLVGRFPNGVSPYGCEEMSGNVREWTRSLMEEYPYDFLDGREDLEADDNICRIFRGGSFNDSARNIRCTVRFDLFARGRLSSGGFRLIISPMLR